MPIYGFTYITQGCVQTFWEAGAQAKKREPQGQTAIYEKIKCTYIYLSFYPVK